MGGRVDEVEIGGMGLEGVRHRMGENAQAGKRGGNGIIWLKGNGIESEIVREKSK